jgi:hypothetical protein
MAVAPVGTPAGNSSSAAGTTLAITYTPNATGNCICVTGYVKASESTATCADNATGGSSTWVTKVSKTNTNTVYIFTCASVKAGVTTITITFATTGVERDGECSEYSGVVSIGATNTNSGTGTTLTVTGTLLHANDYVYGAFGTATQATMTIGTGQGTKRDGTQFTTNTTSVEADNTSASTGSLTVGFTDNVSAAWSAASVVLSATAASSSSGFGRYLPLNR